MLNNKKIYLLFLGFIMNNNSDARKICLQNKLKTKEKSNSIKIICGITGIISIIAAYVFRKKICKFFFKENEYKIRMNIEYKDILYPDNLIDLNNFSRSNTKVTESQLKEIFHKYIKYIENKDKEEVIVYADVVLISYYYDNLEELLKNIIGNKIVDEFLNKNGKSSNSILRIQIEDHKHENLTKNLFARRIAIKRLLEDLKNLLVEIS